MPADSDASGAPALPALPHTWRPLGPRIAGGVAGGALLAVTGLLWIGLEEDVRDSVTPFQRGTVVAMFLLGFACLYALARSRVVAREEGLHVVNGYRRHDYAWAEIVAVRLNPGAPWVVLDLSDGTTASVLAIQSSDGLRAKQAVRQLRALVDRSDAPGD
ncbi:PH domain-containing protein [Nocardioides sp.]|uniref:PH domain-containing protein n=1 Tax=Nocardioides sp. TaxID=35761 RepID=UPI002723FCED|nr:PH domain-containing protein [Nocardioides sp.]MDO9454860.1 PH domain-containing protein [Nocardioides sp.]